VVVVPPLCPTVLRLLAILRALYLVYTAVQQCRTPVPCPVFLCFAILGGWGFLEPQIFLDIALEVFFSIET